MCTISNKLKLCTCSTKDVTRLKNYWVLHRFVKGKNDIIVGETIMPYFNPLVNIKLNEKTILALLNEGNIFDVTMELKDKDRLHLAFTFEGNEEHNNYGFEFKNGKWKKLEYCWMSWYQQHEVYKEGKIRTN